MRRNRRFQKDHEFDVRRRELLSELSGVRDALDAAYMRFNAVTEPELVDACVYEINAAQSRYNYMLRRIRELDGEAAFREQTGREGTIWV